MRTAMEPTPQFPFDRRAITDQNNEWQQCHREYAIARARYQAAREAADVRPLNVGAMTAALTTAFSAEEQARCKLVTLQHRVR